MSDHRIGARSRIGNEGNEVQHCLRRLGVTADELTSTIAKETRATVRKRLGK